VGRHPHFLRRLTRRQPPDNVPVVSSGVSKKIKIVAGVIIAGGIIGDIVGSHFKHHKHREIQDRLDS
jgi:hypothetical protein